MQITNHQLSFVSLHLLRSRDFPLANLFSILINIYISEKNNACHSLSHNLSFTKDIYSEKEKTQSTKHKMQLVALATALAFILVVFLNSLPYIDAVYMEGVTILSI